MTNIAKLVFEYKQQIYINALRANNFNVLKTCRELGANRGDLYNHTARGGRQALVNLSLDLKLGEL